MGVENDFCTTTIGGYPSKKGHFVTDKNSKVNFFQSLTLEKFLEIRYI
jgi:hypothetical protein